MARTRRRWLWRLMLLTTSTLLALGMVEVGMRLWVRAGDRAAMAAWENLDKPRLPKKGEVSLSHICRRSKNPRILYELVPNITDVTYLGVPLATDSHGFRGPERPLAKPANGIRIVALGDSVSFGWGVEESKILLRRLETKLREHLPDRQVDVINTAVPGYNTAMQVAVLEEKGLPFQPDLVIVDFCGNDTDLPNLLPRNRNYWAVDRSYLYDWIQTVWLANDKTKRDPWREMVFDHAPLTADGRRMEHDPDRVPKEYAWMVGWDNWRQSMRRLVDLGKIHGFKLVVTTHWVAPKQLIETCEALGLALFTAQPRIVQYMERHGIAMADYQGSVLTCSKTDPHPTALHNELQFEALWEVISRPGMLELLLPIGR